MEDLKFVTRQIRGHLWNKGTMDDVHPIICVDRCSIDQLAVYFLNQYNTLYCCILSLDYA